MNVPSEAAVTMVRVNALLDGLETIVLLKFVQTTAQAMESAICPLKHVNAIQVGQKKIAQKAPATQIAIMSVTVTKEPVSVKTDLPVPLVNSSLAQINALIMVSASKGHVIVNQDSKV